MFSQQEFNRHVAWFRYLYSAQVLKEQFEGTLDLPETDGFVYWRNPTSFVWLQYYYSSLYVVIESWQELKLRNPLIDFLLGHQQGVVSLLRRFRNGVFHYQPELENPKLVQLLHTGEKHVLLIHLLHDSFVRYYWQWLENLPGTEAQQKELRENVAAFVGWIPRAIEDAERAMKAELQCFTAKLEKDDLAKELRTMALDIKKKLEEFPGIAQTAAAGLDTLRDRMIKRLFDAEISVTPEEFLK